MSRPGTRPTAMGTRGISARTSGLNQLFMGKTGSAGWRTHIAREGLLDALLVLYEECHSEQLMKDKHIASFVDKYKSTINEVKNLRISINDFEVKKVIGRGHFGEVQVVREKTSGDVYAMKILRKDDTLAKENVAFFEEERDIMARASNEWLTHLQYAFQDTTNLYLIMEFHPGGDMLSLLSRFDDVFEESMAQFYLAEMVAAIHSLHTMGYVHRDIKPDNILVDRTGHIKLADFGSAAKLSSDNKVCAKMPVGTPDYVAPEVLMSMNSKEGTYGLECDWWSLGIVAYEMLFGKTPFTEDSIVVTYSNIMDFKNKLKFPSVPEVSHHAKNLMQNLLSDKLNRLGYEGLGCHPFFSSIEWATLRQSVPPFVPTVTSVDDTSNFDDFDPEPLRVHFNFNKPGFSGRDLPFIGFTYTKELASITAVEHLRNTANQECASPMTKNNLERRLAAKTQELQDIHSKYHKTEGSQAALTKQVSELQGVVRDKTVSLKAAQAEKMALEKDLALSVAEIANMKRMLEMERSQIKASDSKAVQLLGHIREANKKTTQMKDEEFRAELEEHQQAMSQLELDRYMATQRASKMEGDLKMTTKACEEAKAKVIELQAKLAKSKEASRQQVKELQAKLDEISTASSNETTELRKKLSKAVESSKEATELMVNLRQEKNRLQDDRRRSRMQRECCQDMRNKMQEALDCQTSLEHRLHTVEQRETRLIEEVQAKHGLHQDLTKQIIELEEKYEAAYGERKRLERSLHKKEAEMEQRVKDLQQQLAIAKREQHHVVERRVAGASQEHQVKIQEQEATITMLQSKVDVLERQIEEMMETKNDKLQQERKELKRAGEERVADLKQEKYYLETQLGKVECELKQANISQASLKKRISELQGQLDQNARYQEQEMQELRQQLRDAHAITRDANQNIQQLEDSKAVLQDKASKLQGKLDAYKQKAEQQLHQIQTEKQEIEDKFETLKTSCSVITELEEQLTETSERCQELMLQNSEMETETEGLREEKERLEMANEQIDEELREKRRTCANQELTISMLKSSCVMLEEQIVDMEALSAKMEEKETTLRQERDSLNEELSQKMMELQKAGQALETEKQAREWSEQKVKEANNTLQEKERTHKAQIEMWQAHVEEHKQKAAKMAQSMNELEKQHAVLEVNLKEVEKACSQEKDDNKQLEKEVSELTGQLQKNKTTTFKLTQSLEQAIERGEQLKAEGQDLENQMETMQVQHTHEKVKLEGTLAQQTKLIDFLQAKVEAPPKKKKKRLFGKSTKDSTMSSIPMQYKELQQALEMERSRKQDLQRQLTKTKAELQVAKMEANTKPRSDFKTPKPVGHTANPHLLSAIVLSPTNQPSPSLFTPVPNARASSKRKTAQSGKEAKRLKERMKHNIPHRLVTGLNTRATKCAVCVDTVHFGRQCAKCQECHQVCHLKCASSLPHTCGLPSQYVQHFSQAMHCKTASPKVGPIEGENGSVTLQSWMKIPRNGKSGWDKKWVVLEGTKLCIYDKENTNGSSKPGDEFDLCPSDGRVTIHAGVTAAELGNTASTDLTYVLRIELHPHTTCWPGRTLFLMASSFSDKQKWMMTLEFVMSEGSVGAQVARDNARLLGNTLLSLEGENKMDINCTLLLSQELMLIGSEDGLFAMASTDKPQPLSQLNGVDSVFQMKAIAPLGIAIMTVGPERRLCFADLTHLKTMASQASVTEAVINYTPIENIQACHLFAYGAVNGAAYICAATPQKIRILKHSKLNGVSKFSTRKEINTSEPCSCLLFTPSSLLAGTDRFYQIDLDQYQIDEFLDSTDTSLAFAVFGASQVNSFPIAVVQIAPDGFPKEYLLCFHEFGVFVDGKGRRTRPEDMKWSRLPLAFMFRGPYLYVTHFNSMEVCEIKPIVEQDSPGIHTFLDLASPRLVGHGMTPGTAYVTSTTDTLLDLICLKGHTTQTNTQEEPRRPLRQHSGSRGSTQNNGSLKRPLSEASANQPSGKMLRSSFQNSSMMSRQSSSCSSSSTSSWASSLRRSPRFRNMSSSDEESVTSCSSLHKRFTPSKQGKFTAV
ncbi:citron Rho-interacting kinase-like isoform X2 [Patiria miniata]|uniref:non-specific serine/threonine protein kinase n=1 Tax=Patiria miniata TaxID=46514 RepID=A0A913ZUS8_PATMI|nr:citron Rho-interacting kinase-like isoform X2 [Patiria miniata]